MLTAKFECQNLKCQDSYKEVTLPVEGQKLPVCIQCQEQLVLIPEVSSIKLKTSGCTPSSNPYTH